MRQKRINYVLDLVEALSLDYNEQYQGIEPFAKWNLPEEIGLEWIDAYEMGILTSVIESDVMPENCQKLLIKIYNDFNMAFDNLEYSEIWTHQAMESHPFWQKQREAARFILENWRKQSVT